MNIFESCEENLNLDIKHEIEITEEPLDFASEQHLEQSSGSFGLLNSQKKDFYHSSIKIEDNVKEIAQEIVEVYKIKEEFHDEVTEDVYEENFDKIDYEFSNSTEDIFSSRPFDHVSGRMKKEMLETDVHQMEMELVKKEINDHKNQPEDHNINSHLDKESFYQEIQNSEFSKVLDRKIKLSNKKIKILDSEKFFTDGRGLDDVPPMESLNSSKKGIEDEGNKEGETVSMEASTSQGESQIMKKFRCSICGFKTIRKRNLKKHLLTHSNTKLFKCSDCDYECNRNRYLKRHFLTHSNTKLFKCSECSYESNWKADLNVHLLNNHSSTKLFKCSECDYESNRKGNLKNHLLTHSNTKLFKCSECDFECIQKGHLKLHVLTHSNMKLFKCFDCDYECNRKADLKLHSLTHLNTKLFKCSECDYESNIKGNLKSHLLSHSNTKLFKCSECDYECNYKRSFKLHLLTHSPCILKRHKLTHSNTKLYKCSVCDYEI